MTYQITESNSAGSDFIAVVSGVGELVANIATVVQSAQGFAKGGGGGDAAAAAAGV